MMSDLYVPKGGMCRVCTKQNMNCSDLPFEKMNQLEAIPYQGRDIITVRCAGFEKAKPDVHQGDKK